MRSNIPISRTACLTCPVRGECAGGRLFDKAFEVVEFPGDRLSDVANRIREVLRQNNSVRAAEGRLHHFITGAKSMIDTGFRVEQAMTVLTRLVMDTGTDEPFDPADPSRSEDETYADRLERVMTSYSKVLPEDLDIHGIREVRADVLRYVGEGVCHAWRPEES